MGKLRLNSCQRRGSWLPTQPEHRGSLPSAPTEDKLQQEPWAQVTSPQAATLSASPSPLHLQTRVMSGRTGGVVLPVKLGVHVSSLVVRPQRVAPLRAGHGCIPQGPSMTLGNKRWTRNACPRCPFVEDGTSLLTLLA